MTLPTIAGLPVKKVTEHQPYFNMLVYGESGSGKTTLAGSADAVPEMRRVLLIDVEGGTLSLRDAYPNVETVRVKSWQDMQNVYNELYAGGHGYTTLVVDSLTETQKMCYSSDTELLTLDGWKTISSLTENDMVAQYEMGTELISFVKPSNIISYHHHGDMISIPTKSSGLLVTPNHRVLTNTAKGSYLRIQKADELRKGLRLPTAGTLLSSGGPTPEQARLLVAWAADGHRNFNGMKFHLKKQDKIERLKKLIVDCDMTYYEPDWKDDGQYIIVNDPQSTMAFMPDRLWKMNHVFWSLASRDAMMSEMPFWDSTAQPSGSGSFCYRTSYRSNADAICAIAALTGWSASISTDRPDLFRVNLVRTTWRTLTTLTTEEYNDKVWCVTVPSGLLVTRRNDKVTICGNSMDKIMRKLVEEYEERDADVPGVREWNINIEQTRKFVRAFRDLPVNTIFTALVKSDKNLRTGAIKRKPSLNGKVADEVAGFLDIVTYLYVKEVDQVNKRMLLCGQTEDTVAKDRTAKLSTVVENPTMEVIWNAVRTEPNSESEG